MLDVAFALAFSLQDPPPKPDFAAELRALIDEYGKAAQKYYEPWAKAKTEAERAKAYPDPDKHPAIAFAAKYLELADRAKGTDTGAKALTRTIEMGSISYKSKEAAARALEALLAGYPESAALEESALILPKAWIVLQEEKYWAALRTIAEKSPHRKVRAAALFSTAETLSDYEEKRNPEEAARLFGILKKDYADTPYGRKADGHLFALEHLQVGKTAPDFEATDQDGTSFKLSDYRGKVTVIGFWGFW